MKSAKGLGNKHIRNCREKKRKSHRTSPEVSIESTESSVVVVGHRVTQEGLEYLVKGLQEPDSAGIWTPRENLDSTLVTAYTRQERVSRCST